LNWILLFSHHALFWNAERERAAMRECWNNNNNNNNNIEETDYRRWNGRAKMMHTHTNKQTEEVKQICKSNTSVVKTVRLDRFVTFSASWMISLRRYSTSGASALATSSEMTIPNASAIVWTDCAERCVKSFCWAVADILSLSLFFFFACVRAREEKKVKNKKTQKRKKKRSVSVQTERVKYVPSRARREIFITQQQQLLLLFAYTMYRRAYKCAFVCVSVRETEVDGVNLRSWVVREREAMITVDYYFARSLLSSIGICAEVFRASFSFSCLLRFRSSFLLSLSLFPREDEEEVIKRDFLDWCRVRKRVRMTVYDCKKTPQSNASRTNMVWLLTSRCSFFHLFLSPFFIFYTYNILAFGEKQNEWKREAEQRRGL